MSPKKPADMNQHRQKKLKKHNSNATAATVKTSVSPLSVSSVFHWETAHKIIISSQSVYGFSDSSGDEYEDTEIIPLQVTKANKMKKLMDSEIDLIESQQNSTPKSSDEFDRLLLGSPNSSYIWIQYMAFHVDLAQLNSARNVAERALNAISPELIEEKKNMWFAYLNLEHQFGSDETLSRVVQRAVAYNDPEEMYIQFVAIVRQGDKSRSGLLEQTFATMIHKFSQNLEIWKLYLEYLLDQTASAEKQGIAKEAAKYTKSFEDMLAQALSVLPAKTHVSLLSALARKQYKNNNVQAGRNMFDTILDKYPRLTDQWNIYIDMETGYGEIAKVRELFERASSLHHSSKNMQSLLKKYMAFETKHGTLATKEHVKEIAVNYLNKKQ